MKGGRPAEEQRVGGWGHHGRDSNPREKGSRCQVYEKVTKEEHSGGKNKQKAKPRGVRSEIVAASGSSEAPEARQRHSHFSQRTETRQRHNSLQGRLATKGPFAVTIVTSTFVIFLIF